MYREGFAGMKKSLIITYIIGSILGIVWILLGINIYAVNAKLTNDYNKTTGQIVSIDEYDIQGKEFYSVLVRYEVNGEKYNSKLDYYDSSMNEGDEISIGYNTESINDITYIDKGKNNATLAILIGAALLMICPTMLIIGINKTRIYKHGESIVVGKVSEISHDIANTNKYKNQRFIVTATTRNPQTGKLIEARLDNLEYENIKDMAIGQEIELKLNFETGKISF